MWYQSAVTLLMGKSPWAQGISRWMRTVHMLWYNLLYQFLTMRTSVWEWWVWNVNTTLNDTTYCKLLELNSDTWLVTAKFWLTTSTSIFRWDSGTCTCFLSHPINSKQNCNKIAIWIDIVDITREIQQCWTLISHKRQHTCTCYQRHHIHMYN